MEALPNQNDQPSTVFIFGAGASYGDGVPLQADILPSIIKDEDPQLKHSETAKRLRRFLTEHFKTGVGSQLVGCGEARTASVV